jgi:hypothetical protein
LFAGEDHVGDVFDDSGVKDIKDGVVGAYQAASIGAATMVPSVWPS